MVEKNEIRKGPDYSKTAVNLSNPPEVGILLSEKRKLERQSLEAKAALIENAHYIALQKVELMLADLDRIIRETVERVGSFQDLQTGEYAVKFKKVAKEYHVVPFKTFYPKFTPVVVAETINIKALEGLIKGGLLNEEHLKREDIITEIPSYGFYIR